MLMLATAAWSVEVTFDATVDFGTGSSTAGEFQIEKDGVTVHVTQGMANGQHYRFYKNKLVTISSSSEISQIVFTCIADGDAQYGPGCFTATPGEYTYEGKIGTWTGSSNSIEFNPATNQVRATKIVVTIGQAGLSSPVIKPNAGTYFKPVDVTITCTTPGAKVYYTTNGSDPTTSSTEYSAPFTLNTTTTVKAISALDGEVSGVVTAEYKIYTPVNVSNIAAYAAKDDETAVKFINPVYAIAQNGKYLYVKDNSGFGLFYGDCGQTYQLGSVIPGGFAGLKTTYAGEPELTYLNDFKAESGTQSIDPETISADQVGHSMWAHYVYLEGATIDPTAKILTDANGKTAPVHFSMGVADNQVVAGVPYKVWAVVGSYKPNNGDLVYQLLPIKVQRMDGQGVGIGDMGSYEDNTMLVFDFDATVLFHGNSRLFVKDDKGGYGLIYGNVGQTYKKGDVFPAGYGGKKTTYGGEPELATPFSGFEAATKHVTVIPEDATPLDANHEHFAHYVVMYNVTVSEYNNNGFTITDANGNTCKGYNQFGQNLHEGFYERLEGIIGSYGATNTVYQLLPIIEEPAVPVASINELYALNSGQKGSFSTQLTAIYQNGVRMYVQDVEGTQTLVYGGVPGTFVNGDLINNAIASWSTYQGAKQMVPQENFNNVGHGTEVQPDEPMPIEELSMDMVHRYISFKDVDIIDEDGTLYIVDETGRIKLFNQFNVEIEGTAPYYIEGFLATHSNELEVFPILIKGIPEYPKGDVNGDGEVNIGDINKLVSIILGAEDDTNGRSDVNEDGEVNIADINAVIAIILGSN